MAIIEVSGGGSALQDAITSASDGDTIIVDDGVYSPIERLDITTLNITAKNKHKSLISTEDKTANLCWFVNTTPNTATKTDIKIDGFIITNNRPLSDAGSMPYLPIRGGYYTNCIFRNIASTYSPIRACKLYNCLIHDCESRNHCLCWGNHLYNCTITNCKTNTRGWFLYGRAYNSIFHNITGWDKRGYDFASVRGANNFFPEEVPNCTDTILGTDALLDSTYHLKKDSPCIGAGNAEYLQSTTDLDDKEWKTPPSIGCYEFYDLTRKFYLPSSLHPLGL